MFRTRLTDEGFTDEFGTSDSEKHSRTQALINKHFGNNDIYAVMATILAKKKTFYNKHKYDFNMIIDVLFVKCLEKIREHIRALESDTSDLANRKKAILLTLCDDISEAGKYSSSHGRNENAQMLRLVGMVTAITRVRSHRTDYQTLSTPRAQSYIASSVDAASTIARNAASIFTLGYVAPSEPTATKLLIDSLYDHMHLINNARAGTGHTDTRTGFSY